MWSDDIHTKIYEWINYYVTTIFKQYGLQAKVCLVRYNKWQCKMREHLITHWFLGPLCFVLDVLVAYESSALCLKQGVLDICTFKLHQQHHISENVMWSARPSSLVFCATFHEAGGIIEKDAFHGQKHMCIFFSFLFWNSSPTHQRPQMWNLNPNAYFTIESLSPVQRVKSPLS